jgi:K+/H+ antiporter YhaU regulatory subunit KhtT
LVGKSIKETQLLERYRIAIIAISRPKRSIDDRGELHQEMHIQSIPSLETVILEDDILVVVGNQLQIESIAQKEG